MHVPPGWQKAQGTVYRLLCFGSSFRGILLLQYCISANQLAHVLHPFAWQWDSHMALSLRAKQITRISCSGLIEQLKALVGN